MLNEWYKVKKGDYLYGKVMRFHPSSTKNGYVLEHRLVMENFLGRYLNENEVVHHINEDTHDNRIENLRLMTAGEHVRLHKRPRKMVEHVCPNCGITFIRRPKGKADEGVTPKCSRKCNGEYSRKLQLASNL